MPTQSHGLLCLWSVAIVQLTWCNALTANFLLASQSELYSGEKRLSQTIDINVQSVSYRHPLIEEFIELCLWR